MGAMMAKPGIDAVANIIIKMPLVMTKGQPTRAAL
jgi:hypothetical protein